MNQVFDFNRWLFLVGKHWVENRKRYLLALISIAGLLFVWFLFVLLTSYRGAIEEDTQVITYYFGLFLVGCLYGSMLFSELASRPQGINYLLVPASTFEKLLCFLFYGVIGFFVLYTAIFYLIDVPMVKISNAISYNYWLTEPVDARDTFEPHPIANVFWNHREFGTGNQRLYFFLIYIAIQSAFITGSLYFPSYSVIKTTVTLLLLLLFFYVLIVIVLNPILPHGSFNEGFTSYRLFENNADTAVVLPEWIDKVLFSLFQYAFAPIFWTVAFFRLREKEI